MNDPISMARGSSRNGRIVTFYSYKGGTGRTMALANVAWILAANGHRVLVADWDLESPGLHRFYHPFLDEEEVKGASGIIDLVRQYELAASAAGPATIRHSIPDWAKIQPHALSVRWDHFQLGGSLEFLSAGRQNIDYTATLGALDWDKFHANLDGGEFLDAIRDDMKRHYDYVLIDSRTGLSDIASICTFHLPDVLIDCFTLSTQGIEGAADVAKQVAERHWDRGIRILPVPMRVDQAEKERIEAGRAVAVERFAGLPGNMSEAERGAYWAEVEVPYQPFYSYEETLAVFGDPPGSPRSLLASFERLTSYITDGAVTRLPQFDEQMRNRTKQLFTRKPPVADEIVTVFFAPEDEIWGEWIANVLTRAGVLAHERRLDGTRDPQEQRVGRALAVMSSAYIARFQHQTEAQHRPDILVYVTTTARPSADLSGAPSAVVADLTEQEAIDELHRLVGIPRRPVSRRRAVGSVRYPGVEPRVNTAPVPNIRFTGRDKDLRQLRDQLRRSADSGGQPVALEGLGGVGKTQVAIEYVHRFKTGYDVIWWIDCAQPNFIDASLADLADRVCREYGTAIPQSTDVAVAADMLLQTLAQGKTDLHWLLIYDNADEVDLVKRYLPSRGADVVITSRSRDWTHHDAYALPVDVFDRRESIAHLRMRIPDIELDHADEIGRLLHDLPLAVATAGAWIAETAPDLASYIGDLEHRATQAVSFSLREEFHRQTLAQTWESSLARLHERSPAAARLFELCSAMAASISLDLLYSRPMAAVLETVDPDLVEPMLVGRLVREIDKLALIKLDHNSRQILIHPLVQEVVRERMSADGLAIVRRQVHAVLAQSAPSRDIDNRATWDRYRQIWPHLDPSRAVLSDEEQVRQLFIDRLRYLWLRRDLERGRQEAVAAINTWDGMLEGISDSPIAESLRRQLLRMRVRLATILRDQAKFDEAKALDEGVLAQQRKLLGEDHPHTLTTAGGLAADLRGLGRYAEALDADKVTHRAWIELYGEGNPEVLRAANNLAVSYRVTGDISNALSLDSETVQRLRTTLGPRDPQTLRSACNVVRDLIEGGQYTEAAAQVEATRQMAVEALGADSFEAMNAELLLGIALRCDGQPVQAEPRFLAALADMTSTLGESSSAVLAGRLSHAINLLAFGRRSDAIAEIAELREIYEERLGPRHPHTLLCLVDLACAMRAQGPDEDAIQLARSALNGLLDGLGENHPHTLAAMSVLAVLLADAGDLREAECIEAEAAERLESTLGPRHPDTLRLRANLLLTRQQLGSGDAAERTRVIDELAGVVGDDHPHVKELREERRVIHTVDPQPF